MNEKYFTKKGVEFLLINIFWFIENAPWLEIFTEFNYEEQDRFINYIRIILKWKDDYMNKLEQENNF